MTKISRKASTLISYVLAVLLLAALAVLYFTLPLIADAMIGVKGGEPGGLFEGAARSVILALSYLILVTATAADVFLLLLLHNVRKGMVFTDANVAYIRIISWCCIAAGVLFAGLTHWFFISGGVAIVALFVGLCLRVVKNAFEEAAALKTENDYTI